LAPRTLSDTESAEKPTTLRLSSPRQTDSNEKDLKIPSTPRPRGARVPITAKPTESTPPATTSITEEDVFGSSTAKLDTDLSRFLSSSLTSTNIMDTSETPVAVVTSTTPLQSVSLATSTSSATSGAPEATEAATTEMLAESFNEADYATYLPNLSGSRHDVLITTHEESLPLTPPLATNAKSCHPQLKRTLEWPRTAAGKIAALPCPLGTHGAVFF